MRKSNGMKWTIENLTHNFLFIESRYYDRLIYSQKSIFSLERMGRFGRSRIFHTSTIDFFRTLFSIFFTAIYLFLFIFWSNQKISYRNDTRNNVRKITVYLDNHKLLHAPKKLYIFQNPSQPSDPSLKAFLFYIWCLSIEMFLTFIAMISSMSSIVIAPTD